MTGYRVSDEIPWKDEQTHCPGLIARYTMTQESDDPEIYKLETQTWSNIRKTILFHASDILYTEIEESNEFSVIFHTTRGKIIFKFDSKEDASRFHDYCFYILDC